MTLTNKHRNRWSLMVIRGADKHVKHFHVTKRSIVAAPVAAVLAVSGCFVALQLRSGAVLESLKHQSAEQSAAYQATLDRKEETIQSLEEQVSSLSEHTDEMKAKLRDLYELEAMLQQFMDNYGGAAADGAGSGSGKRSGAASESDKGHSGASAMARGVSYTPPPDAPVTAEAMLRMLAGNSPDFEQLSGMLDVMTASMEYNLEQARLRKAEADAYPSGWPTLSRKLTSSFGYRTDPFTGRSTFHAGIDISGRSGDPVYAAADGVVDEQDYDRSRGNYVVLKHRNGLKTVYMHLKRADVEAGDTVRRGEQIGQLGSTGRSTGPHLHFEIMQDDETVNPVRYLSLVKED